MVALLSIPPPVIADLPPEAASKQLFRLKAEALLTSIGQRPLRFRRDGPADLSVIVVVHRHLPLTLLALASLRDNYSGSIELILVDSGSGPHDGTRFIENYVDGVKLLRFDQNIQFLRGCNAALQIATGEAVLLVTISPMTY